MRNFLVALVILLLFDLSCANALPNAPRMKREEDFAALAMAGASAVLELMQKGGGVEHNFNAKSGNEHSNQISSD